MPKLAPLRPAETGTDLAPQALMIEQRRNVHWMALLEKARRRAEVNRFRPIANQVVRSFAYFSNLAPVLSDWGKPGVVVLMYHKVQRRPVDTFGRPAIDGAAFEQHLRYLTRHFNVVPLTSVLAYVIQRAPLDLPAVALTFDDGYRNTLYVAQPLLAKYAVPATLYVPTDLMESERWMWGYELERMVEIHGARDVAEACEDEGVRQLLSVEMPLPLRAGAALDWLKEMPEDEREPIMERLRSRVPVELDEENRFLRWSEIKALVAAGMSIGSHTASHCILTQVSREQMEDELSRSREVLREKLGVQPLDFAYPNGNHSPELRSTVARYYRSATTTEPGENAPGTDPLQIRRVCAPASVRDLAFDLARIRVRSAGSVSGSRGEIGAGLSGVS